jgi:hypothetical protein
VKTFTNKSFLPELRFHDGSKPDSARLRRLAPDRRRAMAMLSRKWYNNEMIVPVDLGEKEGGSLLHGYEDD